MNRTVSDAMHDAIHLLAAAHAPLTGMERMALDSLRMSCQSTTATLVRVRGGRRLYASEVEALIRVTRACFQGAGGDGSTPPPGKDTPPGGTRQVR